MAYEAFANFYDMLNEDADYDALFRVLHTQLQQCGIHEGIVADLGCGTGELTLRFAKAGYDMIAVDSSAEMLSILREKIAAAKGTDVLLLQQDLTTLDLYGTVRAAVCTFDTLNHIGPYTAMETAIARAALFLEQGCPFVFDMNTPYKHEVVLADNVFVFETDDETDNAICEWKNTYDAQNACTGISIEMHDDAESLFSEHFYEYSYTLQQIEAACANAGLRIQCVQDGETFGPLRAESERFLVTAIQMNEKKGNA